MPTKKKNLEVSSKKEKEMEEKIQILQENIKKIENFQKLEEKIRNKKQAIREDLQKQLILQGKFGKQFDDMIEDYLYFIELKERLQYDLDVNGMRYKTTTGNGFTSNKPNESYERLLKTNAQMLKILQDLELKSPEPEKPGDDEIDLL